MCLGTFCFLSNVSFASVVNMCRSLSFASPLKLLDLRASCPSFIVPPSFIVSFVTVVKHVLVAFVVKFVLDLSFVSVVNVSWVFVLLVQLSSHRSHPPLPRKICVGPFVRTFYSYPSLTCLLDLRACCIFHRIVRIHRKHVSFAFVVKCVLERRKRVLDFRASCPSFIVSVAFVLKACRVVRFLVFKFVLDLVLLVHLSSYRSHPSLARVVRFRRKSCLRPIIRIRC